MSKLITELDVEIEDNSFPVWMKYGTRWQYKTISGNQSKFETILNELGDECWEHYETTYIDNEVTHYLKRPLNPKPRRD